ncbi:hypothetical protein ACQY0O_002155 [Thecaphora frezii]
MSSYVNNPKLFPVVGQSQPSLEFGGGIVGPPRRSIRPGPRPSTGTRTRPHQGSGSTFGDMTPPRLSRRATLIPSSLPEPGEHTDRVVAAGPHNLTFAISPTSSSNATFANSHGNNGPTPSPSQYKVPRRAKILHALLVPPQKIRISFFQNSGSASPSPPTPSNWPLIDDAKELAFDEADTKQALRKSRSFSQLRMLPVLNAEREAEAPRASLRKAASVQDLKSRSTAWEAKPPPMPLPISPPATTAPLPKGPSKETPAPVRQVDEAALSSPSTTRRRRALSFKGVFRRLVDHHRISTATARMEHDVPPLPPIEVVQQAAASSKSPLLRTRPRSKTTTSVDPGMDLWDPTPPCTPRLSSPHHRIAEEAEASVEVEGRNNLEHFRFPVPPPRSDSGGHQRFAAADSPDADRMATVRQAYVRTLLGSTLEEPGLLEARRPPLPFPFSMSSPVPMSDPVPQQQQQEGEASSDTAVGVPPSPCPSRASLSSSPSSRSSCDSTAPLPPPPGIVAAEARQSLKAIRGPHSPVVYKHTMGVAF